MVNMITSGTVKLVTKCKYKIIKCTLQKKIHKFVNFYIVYKLSIKGSVIKNVNIIVEL